MDGQCGAHAATPLRRGHTGSAPFRCEDVTEERLSDEESVGRLLNTSCREGRRGETRTCRYCCGLDGRNTRKGGRSARPAYAACTAHWAPARSAHFTLPPTRGARLPPKPSARMRCTVWQVLSPACRHQPCASDHSPSSPPSYTYLPSFIALHSAHLLHSRAQHKYSLFHRCFTCQGLRNRFCASSNAKVPQARNMLT